MILHEQRMIAYLGGGKLEPEDEEGLEEEIKGEVVE